MRWLREKWCRTFHRRISLPIHGKYMCWHCGTSIETSFKRRLGGRIPMSVYLYHPDWDKSKPVMRRKANELSALLNDQDREDWHEIYVKYSKLNAEVERGYYMQWTGLLQKAVDVPRSEYDFRRFTFREMRQIRNRLRALLAGGRVAFSDYCWNHWDYSSLTFRCWTTTLRWAEEIFARGEKTSKQIYLA